LRVVFFSKGGLETTSSRYRCFYFAQALRREGIETVICDPPPRRFGWRLPPGGLRELARLAGELRRVGRQDLLYLQRPIHNTPFTYMAAAYKSVFRRRMIFDLCDPVYIHSPRKSRLLARRADAVVVSCEDLAVWARRHNRQVHVVPNSVRPEEIAPPRQERAGGRPIVGWTGVARHHEANLRLLPAALARVRTPCTFRLIGARGADGLVRELAAVPGLDLEVVDWLEHDQVAAATAALDVAVLPLVDTPWNGKLVTKLIEYLAAGVPVIASPVGENRFAIEDGVSGFLAATADEWAAKLDRLLGDPGLRLTVGEAGRRTARERYSLAATGPRLARIVRQAAGWQAGDRPSGRRSPATVE
jgi:glycosyltransferase involved in cell wall biosynthesis